MEGHFLDPDMNVLFCGWGMSGTRDPPVKPPPGSVAFIRRQNCSAS